LGYNVKNGLSTEQHRHARREELDDKPRRIASVVRHIVGEYNAIRLEPRANSLLQWWEFSVKPRSVGRDPVGAPIEIDEHRRIAAGGDNPVRHRSFLELVTPKTLGSLAALDPVFSIENICRPAIGIAYGGRIRQGFDLLRSPLAVVAIADATHDGLADSPELDATA
jgi:hypothetical protein